jgi:hypothetical protein
MGTWHHLFVVYRCDLYLLEDESVLTDRAITIKAILRSADEAIREVDRLNALKRDKGSVYSFQSGAEPLRSA